MHRAFALVLCVAAFGLVLAGASVGADMTSAARRELSTAINHADLAARAGGGQQTELHLHHVINCIEGKAGKNYHQASGDPCGGMGNGLFADLKDSGMAGAHAMPYVEIADTVALWGLSRGMAKDVAGAKAAAEMTKMILDNAARNFK